MAAALTPSQEACEMSDAAISRGCMRNRQEDGLAGIVSPRSTSAPPFDGGMLWSSQQQVPSSHPSSSPKRTQVPSLFQPSPRRSGALMLSPTSSRPIEGWLLSPRVECGFTTPTATASRQLFDIFAPMGPSATPSHLSGYDRQQQPGSRVTTGAAGADASASPTVSAALSLSAQRAEGPKHSGQSDTIKAFLASPVKGSASKPPIASDAWLRPRKRVFADDTYQHMAGTFQAASSPPPRSDEHGGNNSDHARATPEQVTTGGYTLASQALAMLPPPSGDAMAWSGPLGTSLPQGLLPDGLLITPLLSPGLAGQLFPVLPDPLPLTGSPAPSTDFRDQQQQEHDQMAGQDGDQGQMLAPEPQMARQRGRRQAAGGSRLRQRRANSEETAPNVVVKVEQQEGAPSDHANYDAQEARPAAQFRGRLQTAHSNDGETSKRCHCKKSQCLKLYCDCFSAQQFCHGCACTSCKNTLQNASLVLERQMQIKNRDPKAFQKKITAGEGVHLKGCNCKKSNCLKKYCECYSGSVPCSRHCKCIDCRNVTGAKAAAPAPAPRSSSRQSSRATSTAVKVEGSWASQEQISRARQVSSGAAGLPDASPSRRASGSNVNVGASRVLQMFSSQLQGLPLMNGGGAQAPMPHAAAHVTVTEHADAVDDKVNVRQHDRQGIARDSSPALRSSYSAEKPLPRLHFADLELGRPHGTQHCVKELDFGGGEDGEGMLTDGGGASVTGPTRNSGDGGDGNGNGGHRPPAAAAQLSPDYLARGTGVPGVPPLPPLPLGRLQQPPSASVQGWDDGKGHEDQHQQGYEQQQQQRRLQQQDNWHAEAGYDEGNRCEDTGYEQAQAHRHRHQHTEDRRNQGQQQSEYGSGAGAAACVTSSGRGAGGSCGDGSGGVGTVVGSQQRAGAFGGDQSLLCGEGSLAELPFNTPRSIGDLTPGTLFGLPHDFSLLSPQSLHSLSPLPNFLPSPYAGGPRGGGGSTGSLHQLSSHLPRMPPSPMEGGMFDAASNSQGIDSRHPAGVSPGFSRQDTPAQSQGMSPPPPATSMPQDTLQFFRPLPASADHAAGGDRCSSYAGAVSAGAGSDQAPPPQPRIPGNAHGVHYLLTPVRIQQQGRQGQQHKGHAGSQQQHHHHHAQQAQAGPSGSNNLHARFQAVASEVPREDAKQRALEYILNRPHNPTSHSHEGPEGQAPGEYGRSYSNGSGYGPAGSPRSGSGVEGRPNAHAQDTLMHMHAPGGRAHGPSSSQGPQGSGQHRHMASASVSSDAGHGAKGSPALGHSQGTAAAGSPAVYNGAHAAHAEAMHGMHVPCKRPAPACEASPMHGDLWGGCGFTPSAADPLCTPPFSPGFVAMFAASPPPLPQTKQRLQEAAMHRPPETQQAQQPPQLHPPQPQSHMPQPQPSQPQPQLQPFTHHSPHSTSRRLGPGMVMVRPSQLKQPAKCQRGDEGAALCGGAGEAHH